MSAAAVKELQTARLALIGSARAGRRTLLDMLLSAKGYEVAVCEDGPSVLEFLKENQPAIAIFDHDLPGMDGREICSRMRFITRLAEIPIAIVTPTVEEMGGVAEFEGFSDTTTADIVEAEPLGKKSLVDRLESVIRDQKGAANAGKMTIAIPTMVPPLPDTDPSEPAAARDGLDVFVDDDVDIEVDVARAIYSNDESHDRPEAEQHQEPATVEAAAAALVEATQEPFDAPAEHGEVLSSQDSTEEQVSAAEADETAAPKDSAAEEFDFFADSDEGIGDRKDEGQAGGDDIEWPAAIEGADSDQAENLEITEATETEPVEAAAAEMTDSGVPEQSDEREPKLAVTDQAPALEAEAEDATPSSSHEDPVADETAVLETDMKTEPADKPVYSASREDLPGAQQASESEASESEASESEASNDEDIKATIEAAIEAVNLAAMEEAQYQAAQTEASEEAAEPGAESAPAKAVDSNEEAAPATSDEAIDVKSTVEMVVERAESVAPEAEVVAGSQQESTVAESFAAGANNYADGSDEKQIDLTTAIADDREEGEPAVLNEERSNMQALIDEQAERIENLQQRNVVLRQELEQRRADDAIRHEERSNLQALIKEQTEAITNLQQRNVQLRQELDQYKAEEARRASERTFLQSHTSEQAETIAKLQQLNALLRQELEQRKADEAPLRDFLQRLLDRDEKSAYQEAVRNEIISLGRDNS